MDGSRFFSVLNRAGAAVSGFSRSVGTQLAAAFSVGAVTSLAKKTMDYADSIEEMSQRIGVSTKALQEWGFAAKQNGADAEKLVTFIERLTNAAQDSANLAGFAKLGINPNGMTPEALFRSVQSQTQGKGAPEIQAMMQGLGLSIKQIGPVMNLLQSDLQEAADAANKFGAVMDDKTVHALAALNDQLSIMGQILLSQFAPALIEAGKLAIAAFARIKGAGGWWGAMTANISGGALGNLIFSPFGNTEELKKRLKALMPDDVMRGEANAEITNAITTANKMIEKLLAYVPPTLPEISTASVGARSRAAAAKSASPYSDSLLSVGNFLGASMRNNLANIAQQQLQVSRDQLATLKDIKRAVEDSGDSGGFPP